MYTKSQMGLAIKSLRKYQLKMSQKEFADILEITQGTISKIENGVLELEAAQMFNMLDKLGVTPNRFKKLIDDLIFELSLNDTEDHIEDILNNQKVIIKNKRDLKKRA